MKSNNNLFLYVEDLREQQRRRMVAMLGRDNLTVEEERDVDQNTQFAMLEQWRDERPLMSVDRLLKIFRSVLPNFPDVPPEEVEARTEKRNRARVAYAAGRMQLSKYAPDKAAFMSIRSEQRLPMLMTDEERAIYVQHAPLTDAKNYNDPGMTKEQIDASIRQHKKEKYRVIVGALKRMIDQNEQIFLRGMDDETLIENYPKLALPCALTQEAVSLLTSAMQFTYDEFSAEALSDLRNRAAAMMDNATRYDKRIAMMADTYYPTIKLEEFYNTPVGKLDQLNDKLQVFNLEQEYGVEANNEQLMECFDNTREIPGDTCFDLRLALPNRVARSLGFVDEKAMIANCFLCDGNGKRLNMASMSFELENNKPLWIIRKDGSGKPVPVMSDLSQRTPGILVGKAAIEAAALPPRPTPLTLGQRIANGFSRFFRRKPTIRGREYDNLMEAYRRSVALREQARTVATTPKGVADEHANLARATANTPREIHEAGLEEILSVLPGMELKPESSIAGKTLASLFVDCAMLSDRNDNFCVTMKDTLQAGKPDFSRKSAIDYLSKHPAFREIVEDILKKDAKLVKALHEGNKKTVQEMITEYGSIKFSIAFQKQGGKTEPSEAYRTLLDERDAQKDLKKSIQPGHIVSEYSADLAIANKDSAVAWRSVMDIYGANRSFRPDWSPLRGRTVYTLDEWNEIKKTNVDVNRFMVTGKPVEEKDFACMAMILTLRPDTIKNVGNRPGTTPFEDITMSSNGFEPRDGVCQIYNEVMLPSRKLLIDCLDHMYETVPNRQPATTGKELLATELTKALLAFDNRMKSFDWSNCSQATSCNVALQAYDFAKEHGMLDLMKQQGLTDEHIKRLEVARVCAKIVNDAADAEADLISENMGRSHLTAAQRKECIDRMALGMTLQAETVTNKVELDLSERPIRQEGETNAQYDNRMVAWSLKLANAVENGGSGYEMKEVAYDLLNGGKMLTQLSRHMLSDVDRAHMAASAEKLGFRTLCASSSDTVKSWAAEVREVHAMVAFQRDKLQPLRKNPEAKNFIAAAEQILQTGRPESKRLLIRMTDDQINMFCSTMKTNPMMNLARLLESTNAARPAQAQKEVAGAQAAR